MTDERSDDHGGERVADPTEFVRLYKEVRPLARKYARFAVRYPEDADDAEDIAAEVLAALFEDWLANPAAFRRPKKVKAWTATAVRNRAKDFHKTRRRRAERQFLYQLDLRETRTAWVDPAVAMRMRGLRKAKVAALASMTEERRQCFLRKHEDDAKRAEIAAALGIKVKKVTENIGFVKRALHEAEQEFLRREA
jgi:RNA polymerase sigma factor (sigma-70 family)